eukprot:g11532.t1
MEDVVEWRRCYYGGSCGGRGLACFAHAECAAHSSAAASCVLCVQEGKTALEWARESGHYETAKMLEEAAKVSAACTTLCCFCQHTCPATAQIAHSDRKPDPPATKQQRRVEEDRGGSQEGR